jgi:hypothetical protein
MDLIGIFGVGIGLLALFWGILKWEANPLDEAIRQAQEWDSGQRKMAKALERK